MADTPNLAPYVLPTGGIIGMVFSTAVSGTISLSRAVSGVGGLSAWTVLYSGAPLSTTQSDCFYLDNGEQLPGGVLLPSNQYVYQLVDANGTIVSSPLTPVSSLQLDRIDFMPVLISILQGAVNTLQLPTGIERTQVLQAMPLTGIPPMPFIVANPDMIQQDDVPIGQSTYQSLGQGVFQPSNSQTVTVTELARRVFRISVLSLNSVERDFYRDMIIAVFKNSLTTVFQQLGVDVQHNYQASSYQTTQILQGMVPGFYGADVILELRGTSNISLTSTYGIIKTITSTISGEAGSITTTSVTTSGS